MKYFTLWWFDICSWYLLVHVELFRQKLLLDSRCQHLSSHSHNLQHFRVVLCSQYWQFMFSRLSKQTKPRANTPAFPPSTLGVNMTSTQPHRRTNKTLHHRGVAGRHVTITSVWSSSARDGSLIGSSTVCVLSSPRHISSLSTNWANFMVWWADRGRLADLPMSPETLKAVFYYFKLCVWRRMKRCWVFAWHSLSNRDWSGRTPTIKWWIPQSDGRTSHPCLAGGLKSVALYYNVQEHY